MKEKKRDFKLRLRIMLRVMILEEKRSENSRLRTCLLAGKAKGANA